MTKKIVLGALLIGLVVLVRLAGSRMQTMDWEERLERMPDSAPPKWMFKNITAIRGNTDRILELVEGQARQGAPDVVRPGAQ